MAELELNDSEQEARRAVCLPLDGLETLEEVRARVEELSPVVDLFKIGKESFTRFGPQIVRLIQDGGSDVFLDLKYHDIPTTVEKAASAAARARARTSRMPKREPLPTRWRNWNDRGRMTDNVFGFDTPRRLSYSRRPSGPLAQLVEQRPFKARVAGSIPARLTISVIPL